MTLRTLSQAHDELLKRDPDCAVSKWLIRQMVINGPVPCIKSGNKYLVDVEVLESYIARMARGEVLEDLGNDRVRQYAFDNV